MGFILGSPLEYAFGQTIAMSQDDLLGFTQRERQGMLAIFILTTRIDRFPTCGAACPAFRGQPKIATTAGRSTRAEATEHSNSAMLRSQHGVRQGSWRIQSIRRSFIETCRPAAGLALTRRNAGLRRGRISGKTGDAWSYRSGRAVRTISNARVISSIIPAYLNQAMIVRLTPGAGGQKGHAGSRQLRRLMATRCCFRTTISTCCSSMWRTCPMIRMRTSCRLHGSIMHRSASWLRKPTVPYQELRRR